MYNVHHCAKIHTVPASVISDIQISVISNDNVYEIIPYDIYMYMYKTYKLINCHLLQKGPFLF